MLQELDQVAVRVAQVVEMSRRLLAERTSLLARLETVEASESALREQLSEQETKVAALSSDLVSQTETVQSENATLREQVQSLTTQVNILEDALAKAKADIENWRHHTQSVRNRVAHVLENLPTNSIEKGE
ncbi:hypothetical protein [Pelistega suis]|uniref:Uncharacterized protein n=1 Tax=Pelistega suis TaxID=1631957 RepID=A0A849P7C1_9BURK|nr:hypothetical protein [Pelistega suis]NOL51903.1 hypothetical protein [Pelistega suis]